MRGEIKRAGKNYCYFQIKNLQKKNSKLDIILNIVMVILFVFSLVTRNWFHLIMASSLIVVNISQSLINKKFGNISGIYENGIIDHCKDYIQWREIHSYNITKNILSGYHEDGSYFKYENIENIEEIRSLLYKNGVKERE